MNTFKVVILCSQNKIVNKTINNIKYEIWYTDNEFNLYNANGIIFFFTRLSECYDLYRNIINLCSDDIPIIVVQCENEKKSVDKMYTYRILNNILNKYKKTKNIQLQTIYNYLKGRSIRVI
uniref:Uncharacterized protein n=1 Tax=viral metagenome TaxID=1070528 RepID=A0A6C0JQP7_9ZZZZ